MAFKVPEQYRVTNHPQPRFNSTAKAGNNGVFSIPLSSKHKTSAWVVASDGMGWEHISVTIRKPGMRSDRSPTWEEMAALKDLFWDAEDTVVQFHPPRSRYVNNHPFCLHLWRPTQGEIPIPDEILVGVKN